MADDGGLLGRAFPHGKNQRQRGFAFGQVIAQIFSGFGKIPRIIQHVIDDLECRPEMCPEGSHGLLGGFRRARQDASQTCGSLEKLGGLEPDDLQIARLVHVGIVAIEQLQHFALGNDIGGVRQDLHHPHVVHRHHHLECPGIHKITHQHTGCIAEQFIGGFFAAPHFGFVHHVVMQQRGGVDELHHGSEGMVVMPAVIQGFRGQHRQDGAQPLAAAVNDVFGHLPHQRDIGVKLLSDDTVYGRHVFFDQTADLVKTHG